MLGMRHRGHVIICQQQQHNKTTEFIWAFLRQRTKNKLLGDSFCNIFPGSGRSFTRLQRAEYETEKGPHQNVVKYTLHETHVTNR